MGSRTIPSYILGRRVKVITGHANFKWLTSLATQRTKPARWCMTMTELDFYIEHRPGITDTVPDTLSRQPMSDVPSFDRNLMLQKMA